MRYFSVLFAGALITSIGSGMSAFALAAWIFAQQGSAASVGLLQMCAFAPMVLLAPIAGTCADRYDRRSLMILGDGGSMIGLLLVLWALGGNAGETLTGILNSAAGAGVNATVGTPADQSGMSGLTVPLVLIGITLASSLAAFTEPALRATVSDLLTPEEYVRASGMLQLAASSKFLISPILAALIMTVSSVSTVLMIDAATALVTVACTLYVRSRLAKATAFEGKAGGSAGGNTAGNDPSGASTPNAGPGVSGAPMSAQSTPSQAAQHLNASTTTGTGQHLASSPTGGQERPNSFLRDLLSSWRSIAASPQVRTVVVIMAMLTLALGVIQTLLKPLLLPHYSPSEVGLVESLAACGMIAGGALVAMLRNPRPDRLVRAGIAAVSLGALLMGLRPSMWWVAASCALVFAALAACNAGAEAGVRGLIPNDQQGRAWGSIGLITQMGFLIAYAVAGPLADSMFTPALMEGGALAPTLGLIFGLGPGRGIGLLISCVGLLVAFLACVVPRIDAAGGEDNLVVQEEAPC
ncbi:MFS transporter [Schaalia canis]|uniref:MFS transporter n=1 Tax=Schaalia canis TaxID=100469 RepID=A0A3P1SHS6_9ACTO|nr:MFS transporter [Schaalia canis]RRC95872.1 MFS transporter [Schaalia canis]